MTEFRIVPFASLDSAAIARALAQIAEAKDDVVDVLFERSEEVHLPPEGEGPGCQTRREEGLAVRLVRGERSWLASRDGILPALFHQAVRQVARALPPAPCPEPKVDVEPWNGPPSAPELAEFGPLVQRALRSAHVAFPARIAVTRHRRWLQIIGAHLVPAVERESYYSCSVTMPWARFGTLLTTVDGRAAEELAEALVASFRSRQAAPPEPGSYTVILGPAAAAVLLHEAVAHALEADTLAVGGNPGSAVGVRLAAPGLHVLDDPAAAPEGARRDSDDEGIGVFRRWLLRDGVVEQPLADSRWARSCETFLPGAGRRSSRHHLPAPRSSFLEVLPGQLAFADLAGGDDGWLLPVAERGQLDPLSGRFSLEIPFTRRIRKGAIAEPGGRCRVEGTVSDLLGRIRGVGREPQLAGAGWCAKGGQRLPVWARTPSLRLDGVRIVPGYGRTP